MTTMNDKATSISTLGCNYEKRQGQTEINDTYQDLGLKTWMTNRRIMFRCGHRKVRKRLEVQEEVMESYFGVEITRRLMYLVTGSKQDMSTRE